MKNFITLLFALLFITAIVAEEKCCSTCPEKIRDRGWIVGFEQFTVKNYITTWLQRDFPYSGLANFLTRMPSNSTEYLAMRAQDVEERMGNNLGRLELKLDGATGVDKDRIPYADYDPALVIALIKALNGTLTKNIIEES